MKRLENGSAAEEIVITYERLRLGPLATKVKYLGDRPGIGFDIQSINSEQDISPRYIEVKSSTPGGVIFITKREWTNLKALGLNAWIYVVDVITRKILRIIQNPAALLENQGSELIYKIKI